MAGKPMERILGECEAFLVDDLEERAVGVVDRVERNPANGSVSALVISSGWFGRYEHRLPVSAVSRVLPAERRLIVDMSRVSPLIGNGDSD